MSAPLLQSRCRQRAAQENGKRFRPRGLDLVKPRGARGYRGEDRPVCTASEVVISRPRNTKWRAQGACMWWTCEDLVREMIPDADARVLSSTTLGFGHANGVVAVRRTGSTCRDGRSRTNVRHRVPAHARPQNASGDQIRHLPSGFFSATASRLPERGKLGRDRGRARGRHRRNSSSTSTRPAHARRAALKVSRTG